MNEDKIKMNELINRIALIESFYEETTIIDKIKLYIKLRKDKKNEHRNNRTMDTKRTDTIYDNGNNTSWNSTKYKNVNNEEIK